MPGFGHSVGAVLLRFAVALDPRRLSATDENAVGRNGPAGVAVDAADHTRGLTDWNERHHRG